MTRVNLKKNINQLMKHLRQQPQLLFQIRNLWSIKKKKYYELHWQS